MADARLRRLGTYTIARNDIYSVLPEDNKYKSAVAMNKAGDVFLWSKEFLLSSNDPGAELVVNLVMAKEHYVYEVTEDVTLPKLGPVLN